MSATATIKAVPNSSAAKTMPVVCCNCAELQRELALPLLLHALDDRRDVFHVLMAGPGLEECDRPCWIARVVAPDRLTQLVQLLDDLPLQWGELLPLHRVVREGGFDLGERRRHGVDRRSIGDEELRVAR